MRKGLLSAWVFLAAGAAIMLSAAGEESSTSDSPAVAAASPVPGYSVRVTRLGQSLTVSIVPDSRQQANRLFGQRYEHRPTIEIYKDDLLLASGQFAFG